MSAGADRRWVRRAVELARESMRAGRGGPFAALVLRDGEVVGSGTNRVTSANDPTAHAEVEAIRDACRTLGNFHLGGCEIVTTCEPCPMCLGAIYWARLERIVFASSRSDAAAIGFDDELLYRELALPLVERRIPAHHIAVDEADELFAEWASWAGKTPY